MTALGRDLTKSPHPLIIIVGVSREYVMGMGTLSHTLARERSLERMRIIVQKVSEGKHSLVLVPPKNVPIAPIQLNASTRDALLEGLSAELEAYGRVAGKPPVTPA